MTIFTGFVQLYIKSDYYAERFHRQATGYRLADSKKGHGHPSGICQAVETVKEFSLRLLNPFERF